MFHMFHTFQYPDGNIPYFSHQNMDVPAMAKYQRVTFTWGIQLPSNIAMYYISH